MKLFWVLLTGLWLAGCMSAGGGHGRAKKTQDEFKSYVILDGEKIKVRWNDGDTFSGTGSNGKIKARLKGFNTLESYGPVHRWGDWTPQELYELAKASGKEAASGQWKCHDTGQSGGYNRMLVDCPGLRRHLIKGGWAHVFVMEGRALREDLELQAEAVQNKLGMWAKGAPEGLLTSLHSADEPRFKAEAYNRVCSVSTGLATRRSHSTRYRTCEEVCDMGSCMTYVPYKKRYGKRRAQCLRPD